jgi:hypothetical protein
MRTFKDRSVRGAALPETAMMMGLFFLLLFGSINMAFLGFNQMEADGATYVAARAAAVSPSSAPSAAASAVAAIFPHLSTSAVTVTQVGSMVQATYVGTSPGLVLLGNKGTGNFNIYSREAETTAAGGSSLGTSAGSAFPFSVGSSGLVSLNNYGSTHNMWLAQTVTIVAAASCQNGGLGAKSKTTCYSASEFAAHCEAYAAVKFTNTDASIPTTTNVKNAREVEITKPTNWDPNTAGSKNSVIYAYDSGAHTYATPTYKAVPVVVGGTYAGTC